jgi:hypothetical protein
MLSVVRRPFSVVRRSTGHGRRTTDLSLQPALEHQSNGRAAQHQPDRIELERE